MKAAFQELLSSKRFLLFVLAMVMVGVFVIAGKVAPKDALDYFEKFAALIATLYGAEEVGKNWKANAPIAAPNTTIVSMAPPAMPKGNDNATV